MTALLGLFVISSSKPHLPASSTVTTTMTTNTTPQYDSMVNPTVNHWVRPTPANHGTRRSAAGRGLFSGLQDVKHYNVEEGWAQRQVVDAPEQKKQGGFFSWWFGK